MAKESQQLDGFINMLAIEEQRKLLADRRRLHAFRKAIEEVVQPGDVVLDLGAGTGILGLMAVRAGASRVYAIEEGEIIELAKEIWRANHCQDQVVFLQGRSSELNLPEKVDVVIADQMGPFGVDAGIVEYFGDARKRFLKRDGRLVPYGIELYIAAVQNNEMWSRIEMWKDSFTGFDFTPAYQAALRSQYAFPFRREHLLGPATKIFALDPSMKIYGTLDIKVSAEIDKSGIFHGIAGWFSAYLSPNVVISNSPTEQEPISRTNAFLPTETPVPVSSGDFIDVFLTWERTEFHWQFGDNDTFFHDKVQSAIV